jgi:predicted RNA-binding Zn-ribbon protein involved in translation (DUF1610 family)
MPNRKSIFLCSKCGWKRVSGLEDSGLIELKNDTMSSRKFRCPQCGLAITPRPCQDPQSELERKFEEERLKRENESFIADSDEFRKKFVEETSDG